MDSRGTMQSGILHYGLSNPSLFNPPNNTSHSINVFKDLVLHNLDKLPNKRIHQDPAITSCINALCDRKDLIIRSADKGGGIVVLDKEDYIAEMNRFLDHQTTYWVLLKDPTVEYKQALTAFVNEGFSLNILNQKEREFLVPLTPRIPVIYYLPKIHKNPVYGEYRYGVESLKSPSLPMTSFSS